MYGVGFLRGLLWDERLVYLGKELFFFLFFLILIDFLKEIVLLDLVFLGRVEVFELEDFFILLLLVLF